MIDPIRFAKTLWPDVTFFREQQQVIRSVEENDETFVPAGNMLGKDFVAGYIALYFFLTRYPARVITTSVKDDHLRVLWGEIGRFIQTCRFPLDVNSGGPLIINHRDIRRLVKGARCPISYLRGMVSERGEGMAGHHARHTLMIIDEASGVDDLVYTQGDTWSKRKLVIGNPNPCVNFFYKGVKGGDIQAGDNGHYHRKVIRIRAEDSPNYRYAAAQKGSGQTITHEEIVPGVISYRECLKRRALWDEIRQCIGLDGEFYEGAEVLLFPPDWLNRAERRKHSRVGECAMGVDSAMGGDNTSWAVADRSGLIYLHSEKTPDTNVIVGKTLALMRRYNVQPHNILFDAGGGGKPHADRLRAQGYKVRSIGFGESVLQEPKTGMTVISERKKLKEQKYVYKNRRAQLYGILRSLLEDGVFSLPKEILNRKRPDGGPSLREQLVPVPLWYDEEGRMYLPPKQRSSHLREKTDSKPTLVEIIGCSPDESDALVLAVFGLFHRPAKAVAGSI